MQQKVAQISENILEVLVALYSSTGKKADPLIMFLFCKRALSINLRRRASRPIYFQSRQKNLGIKRPLKASQRVDKVVLVACQSFFFVYDLMQLVLA